MMSFLLLLLILALVMYPLYFGVTWLLCRWGVLPSEWIAEREKREGKRK